MKEISYVAPEMSVLLLDAAAVICTSGYDEQTGLPTTPVKDDSSSWTY